MLKSIAGRIALFMLIGVSAMAAAGCGSSDETRKIVFVGNTESGSDYEVCQEIWQGVSAYAAESGAEASIYTPDPSAAGARIAMMNAIDEGANVIVCVGDEMASAVYDLQQRENHTEFVLIDDVPTNGSGSGKTRIRGNTFSVMCNRQEAGFLAGYAAVSEGYRKIGFLGGSAGEDDRKYGSGFIQGAEAAGKAMGYTDGEVEIRYRLTTSNAISPTLVSDIGSWFREGCELICVCGSGPEFIGPESAAQFGGKVITADINQLESADNIIAASGINHINVVQLALKALEEGKLEGGEKNFFGLSEGGVTLQLKEGQFQSFTDAELAALTDQITSGEIEIESADVAENPERYEITVCSLIGVEDAIAEAEAAENGENTEDVENAEDAENGEGAVDAQSGDAAVSTESGDAVPGTESGDIAADSAAE
ncbi:MAG: BMP family ABC transporter substrate-binding protein [Eubacterium sp.]|nr:BMP family ABC transporter substrate-binding protein [Eubacterium sp.]